MKTLSIQDLTFAENINGKQLLTDISFSLEEGSITCLCGETGSGKTTLLRLIKNELSPYGKMAGTIELNEKKREAYSEEELSFLVGYVGQNPEHMCVTDRVWRELAFGLENMGVPAREMRRRIAEISAYFGIDEWYEQKTNDLSGGQKQLLCLASVMVMNPKLLLLDEPTAQLDPIAAGAFLDTIVKLNRELGITVLIVEHRLEEILPISDHVLVLQGGKLVSDSDVSGMKVTDALKDALPCGLQLYHQLKDAGMITAKVAPCTVSDTKNLIRELIAGNQYRIDPIDIKTTEPDSVKALHSKETPVLEIKDLWASYEKNGKEVVRGMNLSLFKGEIYCLVGGNGSGKTSALKAIAGQMPYCSLKNRKKIPNIGFLPQDVETVFLADSVAEDYRQCGIQIRTEQNEYLFTYKNAEMKSRFNIGRFLDMHPYDLSGGEKQKVALEKLLLLGADILFLDEPAKGLDAGSRKELIRCLTELKHLGKTILIVTHDTEFAAMCADRIGMFFKGEIFAEETPVDFFTNNTFYTTQAARVTKALIPNVYRTDQLLEIFGKEKKL